MAAGNATFTITIAVTLSVIVGGTSAVRWSGDDRSTYTYCLRVTTRFSDVAASSPPLIRERRAF